LAYLNPAWFQFAAENGGEPEISRRWPIGSPIMPAVPPVLRSFYEVSYRLCLDSGTPWRHEYECSTANVYRRFQQTVYPLAGAAGLIVVNSIDENKNIDRDDEISDESKDGSYRGKDGFVQQCANCRKVRYRPALERWDWVPSWVRRMPRRVAFVLCNNCRGRYRLEPPGP